MDKRIYTCAAVILILVLLALLAYNYLEIIQEKKYTPPSREVYSNRYYAVERWLKETGRPVRIERGNNPSKITEAAEKVAVIYADAFKWENAKEQLSPWIEKGNMLVICLDYYSNSNIDENLLDFLSVFGIGAETTSVSGDYWDENIPNFDWAIHFPVEEDSKKIVIKDKSGFIRLVQTSCGEGTLTVTGYPVFMFNHHLEKEVNARLAWKLTGEKADTQGVLFIRTRYIAKSFFGKIMERGNLIPVLASALITIILGFWMIIPVFGLVFEEKQKTSRPIRERFSAEVNFLKKYKSLDYYLEIYDRELQLNGELKLADDSQGREKKYMETINKIRSVYNGTDKLKRRIGGYKTGTGKK